MKLTAEATVLNDGKLNTNINNAQDTADTATTKADNAQGTANTAVTKADNAQDTADTAVTKADNAQSTADSAQATANQAKAIADNTNQYFWFISSGSDTGAHISEKTQAQFIASPSGGNLLARSNGIAVRDGLTELSTFTADGASLGSNSATATISLASNTGYLGGLQFEGGERGLILASTNEQASSVSSDGRSVRMSTGITNTRTSSNREAEVFTLVRAYPNQDGTNTAFADIYVGVDTSNTKRSRYRFSRTGIEAYDESLASNRMSLTMSTGNMSIAGTLTQGSDRRLKEHISYLDDDAVEFIDGLKPAHYLKEGEKHLGFYAQDVAEIDKWNCMTGEMNGYMTLSYMDLIAPLVTYCQKLEKRIEELERKSK